MPIKSGDTVLVHYIGKLDDGTEFDNSYDDEPLEFVVGKNMLLPAFEESVIGKNVGDKYVLNIESENAYGEPLEDMIFEVPKENLPEHIIPELGLVLDLNIDEEDIEVVIIDMNDDTIVLDANHPLAGEPLEFAIEIMEIK